MLHHTRKDDPLPGTNHHPDSRATRQHSVFRDLRMPTRRELQTTAAVLDLTFRDPPGADSSLQAMLKDSSLMFGQRLSGMLTIQGALFLAGGTAVIGASIVEASGVGALLGAGMALFGTVTALGSWNIAKRLYRRRYGTSNTPQLEDSAPV